MTQNLELSFVDTSLMNQDNVSDPTFFDQQVELAMKNKELDKDGTTRFVLRNLDFSGVDYSKVKHKDFTGWVIENVIFSRPSIEKDEKTILSGFSFVGAKLDRVIFAQAELIRCNFDTADIKAIECNLDKADSNKNVELRTYLHDFRNIPENMQKSYLQTKINKVDFFFSDLRHCRFRNAKMEAVDFRYSVVEDCTLRESEITYGDFYSCHFMGTTTFQKSNFINCSITNAIFEENCIRMNNIKGGLLQVHIDDYREMVNSYPRWCRYNPCMNFSSFLHDSDASKLTIYSEGKEVYKQLSGIYAGKGLNRDSNKAYKAYKDLDLKHSWLSLLDNIKKRQFKDVGNNIVSILGDLVTIFLGYGFMGRAVVIWFSVLVGIFTYLCYDKVTDPQSSPFSLSLSNSLGPFDPYYKVVNGILPSIESIIGILLVGFLGFVIANKIRNDS